MEQICAFGCISVFLLRCSVLPIANAPQRLNSRDVFTNYLFLILAKFQFRRKLCQKPLEVYHRANVQQIYILVKLHLMP